MLYNIVQEYDELNILEYINTYTESIGLNKVAINTVKLRQVCSKMRTNFPCVDGVENASIFKKAAVFVACLIEESPIELQAFVKSKLKDNVRDKNPNAIIALDLAFKFMSLATVTRSDNKSMQILNGIELSMHSYCDILDMLSQDVKLITHFMPLTLLFEQIVYKTHPNMQYEAINFAKESEKDKELAKKYAYKDQTNVPTEWDDASFWHDLKSQ